MLFGLREQALERLERDWGISPTPDVVDLTLPIK